MMVRLAVQSSRTWHLQQAHKRGCISLACARALFSRSKDQVRLPCAHWVFKCCILLACARALSSRSRDRVRLIPHSEFSSAISRWHVQGLSPQGLETEFDYPAHSESSSATSRSHVQGLSHQGPETESDYPAHNESSSATSRCHVQELSTQSRKTKCDCSYPQRVFKCHVSLAYAKAFSSKSKDRVRSPPRTTSLQVLQSAGITLAHNKHWRGSTCKEMTTIPKKRGREIVRCYSSSSPTKRNIYKFPLGAKETMKKGTTRGHI